MRQSRQIASLGGLAYCIRNEGQSLPPTTTEPTTIQNFLLLLPLTCVDRKFYFSETFLVADRLVPKLRQIIALQRRGEERENSPLFTLFCTILTLQLKHFDSFTSNTQISICQRTWAQNIHIKTTYDSSSRAIRSDEKQSLSSSDIPHRDSATLRTIKLKSLFS